MKITVIKLLFYTFLTCACNAVSTAQIIRTYAGNGTASSGGDGGQATASQLNWPTGICADHSGNVYVGQFYGIRKINSAGIISTFAGNGTAGHSGDGGAATTAGIGGLANIGVDSVGNVYFAESDSPRVRRVNTAGIITTIAGNGNIGFSGDGGAATSATFNVYRALAVDKSGNVFVGDTYNHRIRKINSTTGIVTTIAGTGSDGDGGDGGPATAASFGRIFELAVDNVGNLYIRDDSSFRIRKISTAGIITGITKSGSGVITGDGGLATAATIGANGGGMSIDAYGNIYFAESNGNRIRRISSTTGIINTVMGTGIAGFSGDGGPALAATFYEPSAVTFAPNGNFYITDLGNMRVRYVKSTLGVIDINDDKADITLAPNPAISGLFALNIKTTTKEIAKITITNVAGSTIKLFETTTNEITPVQLNTSEGLYFVTITTAHGVWTEKIVVQ